MKRGNPSTQPIYPLDKPQHQRILLVQIIPAIGHRADCISKFNQPTELQYFWSLVTPNQINVAHQALTQALELLDSSSIIFNQQARTSVSTPPSNSETP